MRSPCCKSVLVVFAVAAWLVASFWSYHSALGREFASEGMDVLFLTGDGRERELTWKSDHELVGELTVSRAGTYRCTFSTPYLRHPLSLRGVEINGRYFGGEEINVDGDHRRIHLWIPGEGLREGSNQVRFRFGTDEAASLVEAFRLRNHEPLENWGASWLGPVEHASLKPIQAQQPLMYVAFLLMTAASLTACLGIANPSFLPNLSSSILFLWHSMIPLVQLFLRLMGFVWVAETETLAVLLFMQALTGASVSLVIYSYNAGIAHLAIPCLLQAREAWHIIYRRIAAWFNATVPAPKWTTQAMIWAILCLLPDGVLFVSGRTPFVDDTVTSNFPLKWLAIEQLSEGRMPLWTSKLGSGYPLLADSLSLPFDPRNLWFALLSPLAAYWAMLLTSRLICGWICLAYFRVRHGLTFGAALTATMVYFCGTIFLYESRLHSTAVIPEAFPAILWITERLLERISFSRIMALALGWSALFYIGSVAYLIYLPVLAYVWAAALILFGKSGPPSLQKDMPILSFITRFSVGYLAALLWAVALCGITLFPFVELIQLSNRGGEYPQDPFAFRSLFFALFGAHQPSFWTPVFNGFFYVGVIALPIILVGSRQRNNVYQRMGPPLSLLTLAGLILTTSPLKPYLVQIWPVFSTVAFFRLSFFWGMLAAVLVGHGLHRLNDSHDVPQRGALWTARILSSAQWLALGCLPFIALMLIVLYLDGHHSYGQLSLILGVFLKITFVVIVGFRLLGLRAVTKALSGRTGPAAVGLLLIGELLATYTFLRPRTDRPQTTPYPKTPEVVYLQEKLDSQYRLAEVLASDELRPDPELSDEGYRNLALDGPAVHGLATANIYQSLNLRDYSRFFENFGDMDVRKDNFHRATNAIMATSVYDSSHYDQLAVRYLVSRTRLIPRSDLQMRMMGDSFYVYERIQAWPRAYFARTPEEKPTATATIVADRDSELELRVPCPTSGYLVVSDTYVPGWRVWVNGEEAEILRANEFARAVAMPGGMNHVLFRYEPESFVWGMRMTVVSGILTAAACGFCLFRRYRLKRQFVPCRDTYRKAA